MIDKENLKDEVILNLLDWLKELVKANKIQDIELQKGILEDMQRRFTDGGFKLYLNELHQNRHVEVNIESNSTRVFVKEKVAN